jgi:hypothetical protein
MPWSEAPAAPPPPRKFGDVFRPTYKAVLLDRHLDRLDRLSPLPIKRARKKIRAWHGVLTEHAGGLCSACGQYRKPGTWSNGSLREEWLCDRCHARRWAKAMRWRRWLSRNQWDAVVIPAALVVVVVLPLVLGRAGQ